MRERYIKGKTRKGNEDLINKFSPEWRDPAKDADDPGDDNDRYLRT